MRIAVAGGTGTIGRLAVRAARTAGHEVSVLSRSAGVDLVHGDGIEAALAGVATVIDVSNTATSSGAKSAAFFEAATRNLLAAELAAGVGHHVALSIVGIDCVPVGYYQGKLVQERLVAAGGVPWTIARSTQFHEFAAQLIARMHGPVVVVPRMRSSPVAAAEVADYLLSLATSAAVGQAPEIGGPEEADIVELTRRLIRRRRQRKLVVPVRLLGVAGLQMVSGGLLPTGDGPRGRQTFDEWLTSGSSEIRP